MEELQSTKNLEREILEDARKKAHRILKTAEGMVKTKTAEWDRKTTEALEELEKKFAEQRKFAEAEIMAVLPMDKRRAKTEKIESLLRRAVETWYSGLSRGQVLGFLKKELEKRLAVCGGFGGTGCRAVIHKLTRDEAESILREVLPGGAANGTACPIEEARSASSAAAAYPEFILENNDVRICASLSATADFFLNEKRAELVEALLGPQVMSSEQ